MSESFRSYVHPLEIPRPEATIQELLDTHAGEEWIWGQPGVGLYEGNSKLPDHQVLSVQLTTHRLLFLATATMTTSTTTTPTLTPLSPNLQVSLADIRQTEYYMGFMRSSAKITLFLGENPDLWTDPVGAGAGAAGSASSSSSSPYSNGNGNSSGGQDAGVWDCNVCGFTNPTTTTVNRTPGSKTPRCALCGVIKDLVPASSRPSTPATGPGSIPITKETNPVSSSTPPMTTAVHSPSPRLVNHPENNIGGEGFEIPCPRCTFLNRPDLKRCEVCAGVLVPHGSSAPAAIANIVDPRRSLTSATSNGNAGIDSPAPRLPLPPANPPSSSSAGHNGSMATLRISFRRGGEKEAYKRLRAVLSAKAWERDRTDRGGGAREGGVNGNLAGAGGVRSGFGIDGILQNISLENKAQQGDVENAFKDLEALMIRAGDMVKLVQTLNSKLTQQQNQRSPTNGPGGPGQEDNETQTFLRSSLVQLGLPAPAITPDMVADERKYLEGLANELGGLLTGKTGGREDDGLMVGRHGKGLVGMDQVWGLWNRARGVSLVSPSDFQKTIPLLQNYTRPRVEMMTFPTGLSVLHTPFYHPKIFSHRLFGQLSPTESDEVERALSTVEIALAEGLSVGLAKEMVYLVETQYGQIVRDEQAQEQGGGERWYRNLILDTKADDI